MRTWISESNIEKFEEIAHLYLVYAAVFVFIYVLWRTQQMHTSRVRARFNAHQYPHTALRETHKSSAYTSMRSTGILRITSQPSPLQSVSFAHLEDSHELHHRLLRSRILPYRSRTLEAQLLRHISPLCAGTLSVQRGTAQVSLQVEPRSLPHGGCFLNVISSVLRFSTLATAVTTPHLMFEQA